MGHETVLFTIYGEEHKLVKKENSTRDIDVGSNKRWKVALYRKRTIIKTVSFDKWTRCGARNVDSDIDEFKHAIRKVLEGRISEMDEQKSGEGMLEEAFNKVTDEFEEVETDG